MKNIIRAESAGFQQFCYPVEFRSKAAGLVGIGTESYEFSAQLAVADDNLCTGVWNLKSVSVAAGIDFQTNIPSDQ